MPVVLRQVLIGLGVVALQWFVLGRLQLWGAYPDAVLLFVIYAALRFGRVFGATAGFATGFLLDVLYGTWGIHMFVKTLTGFAVGTFGTLGTDVSRLGVLRGGGLMGMTAAVHQGVFVLVLLLARGALSTDLVWSLWAGVTLYTTAVALVWLLVRSR